MKQLALIWFAIILSLPFVRAQDQSFTSSNQVDLLLEIADTTSDTLLTRKFADRAFLLSQNANYILGEINAYISLGKLDLKQGNFAGAIKNATRANELSANSNFEIGNLGMIHHVMSSGLEGIGAYHDAITHRKKAMNWQLENNPDYAKGNNLYFALSKIGILFLNLEEYDSAKTYFHQALDYSSKINDNRLLGGMYNNIGFVNFKLGETDSALVNYKMALNTFDEMDQWQLRDSFMVSLIKGNMASCFEDNSPLKESYYLEDLIGSKRFGDIGNYLSTAIEYANFLIRQNRFNEANAVLNNALELIPTDNKMYNELELELYQTLTKLYISTGNARNALKNLNALMNVVKSANNSVSTEQLIEAHSSYKLSKIESDLKIEQIEGEKKLAQISFLNKENELTKFRYTSYIAIAFFIVIIFILIALRIRSNAIRKAREKDLKNRLLKLELDYNTERLNQSVLSVGRKRDFAEELMDRVSQIKDIDRQSLNNLKFFVLNELEIDESILDKEKEVQEVGAEFVAQLRDQFENLSESDIQLLSFIKMKLTNKQIAEIKNITQESVKVSKNRLRKKLDIPPGADFFDHLHF
ncbi:MAG: hypothetical protein H6582_12360 [Crocinitomicaceae bacterium]|nr:hypothetical protein [Crocinitomicaceae bacterium]